MRFAQIKIKMFLFIRETRSLVDFEISDFGKATKESAILLRKYILTSLI